MRTYAYFAFPHLGGTYTVFKQLRQGLAGQGIDLRWMSAAKKAHAAHTAGDPFFKAESGLGTLVGAASDTDAQAARALLLELRLGAYEGVLVNVCADRVETNIARYLPPEIRRIMIVHNITPGTYAAAASIRDHVHATVGVSRRIAADLVARHGFLPETTVAIPNAVDAVAFAGAGRPLTTAPLKLLYLGRVEDQAKGVFWLPAILGALSTEARLTVAGDGPDLAALKARLARFGEAVRFTGGVAPEEARRLLATHDVFLMPSRYEGMPMALLEAMASGCVPVASRLAGITDDAVADGRDGLLFPVGDWRAAARAIDLLAADPARFRHMAAGARHAIAQRYGLGQMAAAYGDLITRVEDHPAAVRPALDIADWAYPAGLRPGLRTYLPVPVKNVLRTLRERLAAGRAVQGSPGRARPAASLPPVAGISLSPASVSDAHTSREPL